MNGFIRHTAETAPAPAGARLAAIRKAWGFVPNLHATLAEAPTVLEGYDTLFALAGKGTLTPAEQQVVFLTTSRLHACEYCVSGHSVLAAQSGLDAPIIETLREGGALADPRLEALRRFAAAVVEQRGEVPAGGVAAFLGAGYTRAQVLEVVLIVATKVISNYVNHLAGTPLDTFMAKTAWVAPGRRAAA
ncbi:MAG: carboxymuconolactone decarboxylase family protein [Acetobacteraceae bacterium]|nr:carboxymuconolactone decarboxylase family protein [Acetobacteraceae bacterium]